MSLFQREISRRAALLGGLQMLAMTALAGRLGYLQFIKSDEFTTLAENNRIKLQIVPPSRGHMLDRNGVELARNERSFQLFADISSIPRKQLRAHLQQVGQVVDLPEGTVDELLKSIKGVSFPQPLLLKEHLSWEEVVKAEMHISELPGVFIHIGEKRFYPFGAEAMHLTGYVGAPTQEEAKDQPLLKLPDFKVGKDGVERMFEAKMRGQGGMRQLEVNAKGLAVRELSVNKPVAGDDLRLTIDANLQHFTSARLEGESASVVVLEIPTGNVLTMTSEPAGDPNIFSVSIPRDYWAQLQADKKIPLMNKAVQGQYPPGSTFKMLVGLAGLEQGLFTPQTRIHCPRHFYLGNHRFNCWKEGGHGSVSIHEAIAMSCDTYFYTLAQRLGIDPIAAMARKFGFGDDKLLGFPSEKPGIVPDEAWKKARFNQPWQAGDTVNVGIGQGYILATPLQMAVMCARLVSGLAVTPRLLEEGPVNFASLGLSADNLEAIKKGMDAVTQSPIGTAYARRITEVGMEMGGKTGTSQVRKIEVRGQDQSQLPWEMRHHAFFIGYAPIVTPRFACCVAVEHGGGGSAAAAPIAHDVLLKTQQIFSASGV